MPERCYWNPGSCSRSQGMNFVNTQAACKKKVFITGKQRAPRTAGRGKKSTPSLPLLLSYRDFYSLTMGLPMWDSERCGFLPLALPIYLYQSLSNRGGIPPIGWKCPISFMASLPFSSCRLCHRGLEINVHLGVGTLSIVNKACGDITPLSP